MNDLQIIELIRAGKGDRALDALYKHFPMIRKMVRSRGGNAEDATE